MQPSPSERNELYQRALERFRGADWQAALDALAELHAGGGATPESLELLEDVQLKLRLTAAEVTFKEPPRPPRWRSRRFGVLASAALLLALLAGGAAALFSSQPAQNAVALAAQPTGAPPTATALPPTKVPPTATAVPPTATAVPPTATAVPPTATAVPPTATAATITATGSLQVSYAPGQSGFMRTPQNIAFILDASGSMRALIGDTPKILVAREAISDTISTLPPEVPFALRTYGNQRSGDCTDLSLLAPLGVHDHATLLNGLSAIEPVPDGMTPIGATLQATGDDVRAAQGSVAVILLSDGEENCGGDPVAAAQELMSWHPELRIHVIGFDIGGQSTERLREIARIGNGSYFDAGDAKALRSALLEAVQLSYQLLDEQGEFVVSGTVGGAPVSVPAGKYRLRLSAARPIEADVVVSADGMLTLLLSAAGDALTGP
jgi:hypothetical protein